MITLLSGGGLLGTLDQAGYELLNGIAGRSWALDALITLPLDNDLVKAGVISACFIFAWFQEAEPAAVARSRRILLVTVVAAICSLAATQAISQSVFLPRPFIFSQEVLLLEGDRLVHPEPLPYRTPLTGGVSDRVGMLEQGDLTGNDLHSFPSDHAGFYLTLATGILLASRWIGLLALAWAALVIVGSKLITGQHTLIDVAAGAGTGLSILLLLQWIVAQWAKRPFDRISAWTSAYPAITSAALFLTLYEITTILRGSRHLLGVAKDIAVFLVKG